MADEIFTISLRIKHPIYTHQMIADLLNMIPEAAHSAGEPRRTPKGKLLEGNYKETYCSFSLVRKETGYFVDGLRDLLPSLIVHKECFNDIVRSGGELELYVGVFSDENLGFVFSAVDMSSFSSLNLNVAVEHYI